VGEVVSVSVPTDRETGRARGFAFVEFSSADLAAEAIEKLNGTELGGRALRINEASERAPGAAPRFSSPSARPGSFTPEGPSHRPRPKGSRRNVRARKRGFG
jgi:RNA recognition motif-containing protein